MSLCVCVSLSYRSSQRFFLKVLFTVLGRVKRGILLCNDILKRASAEFIAHALFGANPLSDFRT